MQLCLADRLASGSFADVFTPAPGEKAYKIFRRIQDPVLAHVAPYVFEAEVQAQRIAAVVPELRKHVPAFFGTVQVSKVLDHTGADISAQYWVQSCYAMECLSHDPEERKLGSFFNQQEWHFVQPLEELFEEAGINHLGDASVFYWRTASPILIDFAVTDAAADHARSGA